MQFAKTPGTIAQRAEYLDCLFTNGKKEEALKEWEADDSSCDLHEHHNKRQHLNVGAKLHATAGHADLARTIMSRLYHLYPDHDSSVMMTVFRAHTSSTNEEHHDAAKDIYIGFKKRRASLMTFGDYDACLVGFLEARHLRHARQVFLDMVKDGYLASRGSAVCVEEVLQRLHMLYRLGTDISTMTSIALDAITVLPPAYHGHLFGDWMKFTVVQQAPEAASQILDMMFQRGYTPETFHFNMLLKALVRTKDDSNVLKAENIAWRMIDKARETHKSNDQPLSISERISQRLQKPTLQDLNSVRSVPVANVTTFALMMQHHAKKLQWEHVDYLSRQLKEISLTPNATIMNVLMDNKCRQGAYADAWTIYKRLTSPPRNSSNEGVFPDGASFRCLWKNLRLAYGDYATREDPNLPSPRELLREMTEWWGLCRSRHDADRFRLGLAAPDHGAITALMMHCFSYTQDLAGSLAALHVLRQKFDIFPTEKALDILQSQMAWIDMARDSQSLRSQHFHSRSNARNKERIDHVYQILRQRRLERMNLKDGDHENFTVEEIGDMGLNLLSEFVRVVLKRTYPPELVEDMMETACRSVGAPGMKTGDMDAFEVA
ncbi:hypothetical protein CC86DRAFT_282798 [Ophiobolus disseminans]|uniref:Uncharacterized protein n=1 Tax=Ophiobolus disseminans TaxID=1469910 RepID=A0A6A7AEK7_9PLEO|nr:hypothetical protein CC86DRAFT_282798 [Ophiobolus disseminans]